jgi:hypothetical protein
MATYEKLLSVGSLTASADLSAKQHYLVKVSGANTVALAGAGELCIGSLANKPASGEAAEVLAGIIVPVVAGDAVLVGAEVASDAAGKAVTATTGDRVFGVALTAAGADGEEIRVFTLASKETSA